MEGAVNPAARPLRFFLGGRDLEMATIAALARGVAGPDAVVDKGLGWGARASAYADEIAAAAGAGATPVLVELEADIPLPENAILVDHHGARAAGPTALEQVFALLALPARRWTRRLALIAANDRGHVRAMRALGASHAESAAVRRADRRAQGVSRAEEEAGLTALAKARWEPAAHALLVSLPHRRAATATDPLAIHLRDPPDLVVVMPGEIAFFGSAPRAAALHAALPGGWIGGDPPHSAFWGRAHAEDDGGSAVLAILAAAAAPATFSTDHRDFADFARKILAMRGNRPKFRRLDNPLQGGMFSRMGRTPAD